MWIYRFIFLSFFFILNTTTAQIVISGTVNDFNTKSPLIGATIKVNNSEGTTTNIEGDYTISLSKGNHKLVFSYLGYESFFTEILVENNQIYDVALKEKVSELGLMVVSASKFEQKLEDVTISLDVIGAELIDSKNCITLSDLIRNAPGVQLIDGQLNIRSGSGWSYGTGSRVLVMVDGMPILSADQGEVDFNLIPMENIEQVEIIKGASSALYGSSALNGVVNIKTKSPSIEPKTTLRSFVGFWDSPENLQNKWWGDSLMLRSGISLSHTRKIKNFDLVFSANHYEDRGYVKYIGNEQTRIAANTKLVYDNITFGLNANYMERKSGLFVMWESDTSTYIPLSGTNIPNSGSRFYIDPTITFYKNFFKHTLRSRVLKRDVIFNTSDTINSLMTFNEYQNQFQNDHTTFTSGITFITLMGKSDSYGGLLNGKNYNAYAQLDQDFGKLNLSFGGRYEYFDLNTTQIGQPLLTAGLNYQLYEGWNIRSSFGQGFRFPSMTELYLSGEVGPINLYNNPDLKPESGWTSEVGLKKVFRSNNFKGYIDLVGFLMEYNNMMEFTMGIWGPPTDALYGLGFSSKNVNKARIPGIELTINGNGSFGENWSYGILTGITYSNPYSVYPDSSFESLITNSDQQYYFAQFVLDGSSNNSYTFNNTSSNNTTSLLKYRNRTSIRFDFEANYKNKLSYGFSYQFNSKMVNIDYVFTSPIFNTPPSSLISTVDLGITNSMEDLNKGYHLFDARIKYTISEQFTLGFLCENLLNTAYLIRPAYMGSPRTFMFQFKADF